MAPVDPEFVDNTLDLSEIPQITLPFRDDISQELKDLIRALLINQQNIISNCGFLYTRLQEIGLILKRLSPPTDPDPPNTLPPIPEDTPEDPPGDLPSLYSFPEE